MTISQNQQRMLTRQVSPASSLSTNRTPFFLKQYPYIFSLPLDIIGLNIYTTG